MHLDMCYIGRLSSVAKKWSLNPTMDHGVSIAFVLVMSTRGLRFPWSDHFWKWVKDWSLLFFLIFFSVSFSFLVGYSTKFFEYTQTSLDLFFKIFPSLYKVECQLGEIWSISFLAFQVPSSFIQRSRWRSHMLQCLHHRDCHLQQRNRKMGRPWNKAKK